MGNHQSCLIKLTEQAIGCSINLLPTYSTHYRSSIPGLQVIFGLKIWTIFQIKINF